MATWQTRYSFLPFKQTNSLPFQSKSYLFASSYSKTPIPPFLSSLNLYQSAFSPALAPEVDLLKFLHGSPTVNFNGQFYCLILLHPWVDHLFLLANVSSPLSPLLPLPCRAPLPRHLKQRLFLLFFCLLLIFPNFTGGVPQGWIVEFFSFSFHPHFFR